jgi:hypothetical protein
MSPAGGTEDGHATPEAAARGDIPERFATIVGVLTTGDSARVWMLTNDRPPFEPYSMYCERVGQRWYATGSGGNSFDPDVPPEVLEEAARLGCPDP